MRKEERLKREEKKKKKRELCVDVLLGCSARPKLAETEAPSKEGKALDTGSNNATFMSLLYWLNNGAKQATIKTHMHFMRAHQRHVQQTPALCPTLNPCTTLCCVTDKLQPIYELMVKNS